MAQVLSNVCTQSHECKYSRKHTQQNIVELFKSITIILSVVQDYLLHWLTLWLQAFTSYFYFLFIYNLFLFILFCLFYPLLSPVHFLLMSFVCLCLPSTEGTLCPVLFPVGSNAWVCLFNKTWNEPSPESTRPKDSSINLHFLQHNCIAQDI